MYTLAAFTAVLASALAAPHTLKARATYQSFHGDGSAAAGWPEASKWISSFDDMFQANQAMMLSSCSPYKVPDSTQAEVDSMKDAILQTSKASGVDARVILAIVMQESKGCVRVWSTANGVINPGLMQTHNGPHKCNTGSQITPGVVSTPCPPDMVLGMIQDGTTGTPEGDGLKQLGGDSKNAVDIYKMARKYNAGSVPANGDLAAPGATPSYCSDIANRLLGVVFDASPFSATGGSAPVAPVTPSAPSTPAAPTAPAAAGGACKTPYTVKGGDSCWAIANANKIALAQFFTLNPAVKSDCSNLQPGASVCVA